MSFFKNIFGRTAPGTIKQTQWAELGVIQDEFEIPYLHPLHHSYPSWKGGERWLKLLHTNWKSHIIFTQGLASSNEAKDFELYLETTDSVKQFGSSWQANLVYEVGKIIPKVNNLAELLNTYKYLSVQIDIEDAPDDWSLPTPTGNIGIFLGLPNEHLKHFAPSHFAPLNMKLLRPTEMQYIMTNGPEGRMKLANLLTQQGSTPVSSLSRSPVV